jgi:hypothetical protein
MILIWTNYLFKGMDVITEYVEIQKSATKYIVNFDESDWFNGWKCLIW